MHTSESDGRNSRSNGPVAPDSLPMVSGRFCLGLLQGRLCWTQADRYLCSWRGEGSIELFFCYSLHKSDNC